MKEQIEQSAVCAGCVDSAWKRLFCLVRHDAPRLLSCRLHTSSSGRELSCSWSPAASRAGVPPLQPNAVGTPGTRSTCYLEPFHGRQRRPHAYPHGTGGLAKASIRSPLLCEIIIIKTPKEMVQMTPGSTGLSRRQVPAESQTPVGVLAYFLHC